MEIPKAYEAKNYENDIYARWEQSGYFNPDVLIENKLIKSTAPVFTIILPPPNVTGQLHLGHAAMLAYEDLMIRYHRLQGYQALWLPGTDHAAIATQTKVEKIISAQGQKKEDLGREKFLQTVRNYVDESKTTIRNQIRKMGSSLDWSREKYTLDEDISQTVYQVFKKMYDDGLIYRGNRIVNWCPRCQSTLADDEVEYEQQQANLYYLKYGPVVIATTRPETKLGDTGLAVNPTDKRYQHLLGKELEINFGVSSIRVKVFADSEVDPEFGTGAIGVTPAHSQVDFAWAEKYQLPIVKIIDEQGKMTAQAGKYVGQDVLVCRDNFLADLKQAGLLGKIEPITNNISLCYRCHTPIEPLTSRQWFIAVNKKIPKLNKSLKELSLDAVRTGLANRSDKKIEIIPERFNKVYFHWMENLRDWCISRQIWWGHRIPVWYKNQEQGVNNQGQVDQAAEIYVGVEPPPGEGWVQDEDTLDTWFSSALWTFSTLGWPQGNDFKRFHPTQVLETGYDILFFWVARMIIMTTYTTGQIPFHKVYLHGLVRDRQGRKMSKSLGNGIDPLAMIDKFGADALRLSMIIGVTPGNDLSLYEEKIAGYRNFVNKLWNISRYILMNLSEPKLTDKFPPAKTLADEWLLSEFNNLIFQVTTELNKYRFSQAIEILYEFVWSKLADWYLEIAKIETDKEEILNYILQKLLILIHPFVPFVSEAIWTEVFNPSKQNRLLLMVQSWPQAEKVKTTKQVKLFSVLQKLIVNIRSIKNSSGLSSSQIVPVDIFTTDYLVVFQQHQEIIEKLARVKISWLKKNPTKNNQLIIAPEYSFIFKLDIKPKDQSKEIENLEKFINGLEKKLNNKEFTKKAPAEVVAKEKKKLAEAKKKLKQIKNP